MTGFDVSPLRRTLVVLWVAGAILSAQPAPPALDPSVLSDLTWLTADAQAGRGPDPEHRVAGWVAERFGALGLEPAFSGAYLQPFRSLGLPGRNVGGILPGRHWPEDPTHWILSAHHDHLGVRGGQVHPGAADNAAGVAALLALAQALSRVPREERPCSLLFLAFDQEERGMLGSRAYARQPAVPLAACRLFTTFDILGRGVLDLPGARLAVLGAERSPSLLEPLRPLPEGSPLSLVFLGTDIIGDRSDYVPFRDRGVPFLFFTTGEYVDYHRSTDTVARLDLPALAAQIQYLEATSRRLWALPDRPGFLPAPEPFLDEARSVASVLEAYLAREGQPELLRRQVRVAHEQITAILSDGTYDAAERVTVVGIVRTLVSGVRLLR